MAHGVLTASRAAAYLRPEGCSEFNTSGAHLEFCPSGFLFFFLVDVVFVVGEVFRFTEVLLCLSCYYRLPWVAFSVRTARIWSPALNFRPARYQQTEEQVKVND